ncbi:MAG: hypothetical protein IE883_07975, partial [Epsilonproteobacteria bacterium]|nr:hypothetical protein [Campylobacterota bacterium]
NYENNSPVMYIAKNKALNIDLKNYVYDQDGDAVTITVNSSTLPAGLSIANGVITGTTTATTTGTLNITLSDGKGGTSTQTITLSVIDAPLENDGPPNPVYGEATTIDPTTTFFGVDDSDEIWSLTIGDVVDGSTTEGTWAGYKLNNGEYVLDTEDQGNFDVVSTTATGATVTHEGITETVVFSDAKAVTSINGITTPGLNQVTATMTVINQTQTVATSTEWYEAHYTIWDPTLNNGQGGESIITSLTVLKDSLLTTSNYGGDINLNENLRVKLNGTSESTSGTLSEMVWDGTYNKWTDGDGQVHIDEHRVVGGEVTNGTWTLADGYLTITVPNQGTKAFKVENGVIKETELLAEGASHSETLFYGPTFEQFADMIIAVTSIDGNAPSNNSPHLHNLNYENNSPVMYIAK